MAEGALRHHDVDVTDADVSLIRPPCYLNDSLLSFCFSVLQYDAYPRLSRHGTHFVNAAVAACLLLQCDDPDDIEAFRSGLPVQADDTAFLLITDRTAADVSSSHWTLPVYDGSGRLFPGRGFHHLDSSKGYNTRAASLMAEAIAKLIGVEEELKAAAPSTPLEALGDMLPGERHHHEGTAFPVDAVACAQQTNGYDCGAYGLVHAVILAERLEHMSALEEKTWDWSWPPLLRHALPQILPLEGDLFWAGVREAVTPELVAEFRADLGNLVHHAGQQRPDA